MKYNLVHLKVHTCKAQVHQHFETFSPFIYSHFHPCLNNNLPVHPAHSKLSYSILTTTHIYNKLNILIIIYFQIMSLLCQTCNPSGTTFSFNPPHFLSFAFLIKSKTLPFSFSQRPTTRIVTIYTTTPC